MVGGNVDHIHRRDLYSAARPSRRNCLITTRCDMESLACAESVRRAGLSAAAETLVTFSETAAELVRFTQSTKVNHWGPIYKIS